MSLVVYVLELLLYKLRIDLGRRDIGMVEYLLYGVYIRPVFKQMRGEGMAQRVGSDILVDVRLLLIELDYLPEALT